MVHDSFHHQERFMSTIRCVAQTFALGVAVLGAALAQTYPNKPIRIVTASAGAGSDFIARLIAQETSGPLGRADPADVRRARLHERGLEFAPAAEHVVRSAAGFFADHSGDKVTCPSCRASRVAGTVGHGIDRFGQSQTRGAQRFDGRNGWLRAYGVGIIQVSGPR